MVLEQSSSATFMLRTEFLVFLARIESLDRYRCAMNRIGKWALGTIAMSVGVGGVLWMTSGTENAFADATDADLVARGSVVYRDYCASCHGINLEGQRDWKSRDSEGYLPAPPHDETGHTWHHPDQMLFEITKKGTAAMAGKGYKSRMMGFGDVLSDRDIWASLAYIKSRWADRVRQNHQRRNEAAAQ
jgi:mono/diheme cytochrome c family protein